MNENLSGSDVLKAVLKGLRLDDSDTGYQRLSEILCVNFGVMIASDGLRTLEKYIPIHPAILEMRSWPWMFADDQECQRFYETLRTVAKKSGLQVQDEQPGRDFRC